MMFPARQGAVQYAPQSLSLSIRCCSPALRSLRPVEPLGPLSTLQTLGYFHVLRGSRVLASPPAAQEMPAALTAERALAISR